MRRYVVAAVSPSRAYASSARRAWGASRSPSAYTATLARPASRQARMTRTAISPRLAISTVRTPVSLGTCRPRCRIVKLVYYASCHVDDPHDDPRPGALAAAGPRLPGAPRAGELERGGVGEHRPRVDLPRPAQARRRGPPGGGRHRAGRLPARPHVLPGHGGRRPGVRGAAAAGLGGLQGGGGPGPGGGRGCLQHAPRPGGRPAAATGGGGARPGGGGGGGGPGRGSAGPQT